MPGVADDRAAEAIAAAAIGAYVIGEMQVNPVQVLVANAGSSTFKYCRYALHADGALSVITRGEVEGADVVANWFDSEAGDTPAAIGHRVVHGGARYSSPVLIDARVLETLRDLVALAPLHQPANLAGIEAASQRFPGVPQVACFDTAFHRTHADVVQLIPLPARFRDAGVRRYGFHGLSYDYIAGALPQLAPAIARGRVIVAHLGSGASLCSLRDGKSVDSTMSFTALDGICMSTRPGAIDPGAILFLMQHEKLNAGQIEQILYRESGLLGISQISGDMRTLLASQDSHAKLAVDHFVWRIVREIGALAAGLGGLDGLVFTAGIGERSAPIRRRICESSSWLGIQLDDAANNAGGPLISRSGSRVSVWVIPTDEEAIIARHTATAAGLLPASTHSSSRRGNSAS